MQTVHMRAASVSVARYLEGILEKVHTEVKEGPITESRTPKVTSALQPHNKTKGTAGILNPDHEYLQSPVLSKSNLRIAPTHF